MNDDAALVAALRGAMPPVADAAPSRDLWDAMAKRRHASSTRLWVDAALAAGSALALFAHPDWLIFLAFHL